jgi:hypothetical protein
MPIFMHPELTRPVLAAIDIIEPVRGRARPNATGVHDSKKGGGNRDVAALVITPPTTDQRSAVREPEDRFGEVDLITTAPRRDVMGVAAMGD